MRIHHIAMRTQRLPALEAFYAKLLGLPIVQRDGTRSLWLRAGDALLMLEQADDGEPLVPAGARELIALAIAPQDTDLYRNHLAMNGIAVEAETSYTIYFRDPDGRRIGLSHFPT